MKSRFGRASRSYIKLAVFAAVLLVLCAAANFTVQGTHSYIISAAEVISAIIIVCAAVAGESKRRYKAENYIKSATKATGSITSNALSTLPMPMVVAHADGTIRWYNECFSELFSDRIMHDAALDTILPDIKWGDILRSGNGINKHILINDREYDLVSRLIKDRISKNAAGEDEHSVYIYLIDKTDELGAIRAYEDGKTDVAVICVDNYDEIFQRMNDNEEQLVETSLRRMINDWAAKSRAVLKKIDRDRYYMFFEHKYLQGYIETKFDILENARKLGDEVKHPVSVSIGIGTGSSIGENEQAARTALDMAQGRGGDQAGVKDDTQYSFYGGKTRDYEKSTRVKARAVATALRDYFSGADNVIFVGHKNADYDCFGAAMGLQRAVRTLGAAPYIVFDEATSPAVGKLYDELVKNPEYKGMFINNDTALERLTSSTVVVVLDTHRPTMLQSKEVVERASRVVLIDHHRRATEFINNCSLIYHEPYASSTCEMVAEILQYMSLGSAVTAKESECLYTGILLDTKNFLVKTGVRTFEAASYLRRLGLNTFDVKQLFNVGKDEYDRRADIVKTAVEVAPNMSVAYTEDNLQNIRVIASQAADDMLNINSVRASFVVYPDNGRICVSARSLSDVNVHVIMEALGGGGHSTVAGVQRDDVTISQMMSLLKEAINDYIQANK